MIVHYELLASLISHADYLNLQSYRLLLGMQFFPGVPLSYQIDKFKSGEINDIWLLPSYCPTKTALSLCDLSVYML